VTVDQLEAELAIAKELHRGVLKQEAVLLVEVKKLQAALQKLHAAATSFWVEHGEACNGGEACEELSTALNEAALLWPAKPES
jgi:hypothetical protein